MHTLDGISRRMDLDVRSILQHGYSTEHRNSQYGPPDVVHLVDIFGKTQLLERVYGLVYYLACYSCPALTIRFSCCSSYSVYFFIESLPTWNHYGLRRLYRVHCQPSVDSFPFFSSLAGFKYPMGHWIHFHVDSTG